MTAPTGRKPGRPAGIGITPTQDNSADGVPTPPTELKARGKKEWTRIWEAAKWLHRTQHYMLVSNYCQKIEEIAEWQKELVQMKKISLQEHGTALTIYKPANGQWAPYPQVKLIAEGRAHILAMLGEMKLSPSHLPDDNGADEVLDAMRKQDRGHRAAL